MIEFTKHTNLSDEPLKPGLNIVFVNGSVCPNFLKTGMDELLTYKTPQSIIDFINMSAIIGNPPYDGKK